MASPNQTIFGRMRAPQRQRGMSARCSYSFSSSKGSRSQLSQRELEQFAVHVHQAFGTGTLVQVVDILRAQKKPLAQSALKFGQREVGCVRLDRQGSLSAHGVKVPNQLWIALPGFGRSNLFHAMAVPEPAGAAESRQAAFRADTGAGEHEYPVIGAKLNGRRPLSLWLPFHRSGSLQCRVGSAIFIIEMVTHPRAVARFNP